MVDAEAPNFDVLYVGDSFDSSEFVDVISGEEQDQDQWHVKAVACTENGREAVKMHHPNCIVCEYDLSDGNGIAFLNTVREWYPEVPFILFTTKMETVAEEAVSAGATDCIYNSGEKYRHRLLAARVQNAVEKYRLQQAETQQDERFELFFSESPLGAIQWDDEFCFLRLNRRAEEILGYDEATLQGKSWEVIVAEDDQSHVEDAVAELLSADGGKHVINKNIRADGEVRTLEWHNRAVTDSNGDVRSIFSKFQDITDRASRTLELEEYETIVEALTDPIYVLDETGSFTFVNREFTELVGYDRERIVGSQPSLIKNKAAVEQAEQVLSRLLSSDGPETVTFEVMIQPRDGDPIICEDHMGVLPYTGDSFNGSVGTLRDITQRKQRQQEIKTERDRFQAIFNDAFDAMVIFDDDRQYIKVNEQATELFGFPKAELIGKTIDDFVPERIDSEERFQKLKQTERERNTITVVRSDGAERIVEYAASTNIAPGQYLAILRDVTEHRRRERRFQALVEESNDIISIVDEEGRYQYQSPSVERILGYDPAETLGDKVWEYIHPKDRKETFDQFEKWVINSERAPKGVEYRAQHADGSWRWMEAHGNSQLDNPAVEGYVFNSRDITEQKERRQQLELVDRVLRHNVRNDMNVIRGAAEAIYNDTSGEIAKFAEQIIATSNSLIATAETEREMAQLLSEPADPESLSVNPLVQQAASRIRREFPDATVTVECSEGVRMRAATHFRQAIEELLTNAIIHNDAESPEVTVTVVETSANVRIEIADTGPQIPAMEREVLLGNEERSALDHGSGLGLWFVQLLVSRSGGSIEFTQNSPTDNIVTLELPLH